MIQTRKGLRITDGYMGVSPVPSVVRFLKHRHHEHRQKLNNMDGNILDKYYISAVKLQERGTRIVHSLEKDNSVRDYKDIDDEIERTLCIKIRSIQGSIDDLIEYMDNNDL